VQIYSNLDKRKMRRWEKERVRKWEDGKMGK
jgi:hypothetical protein